MFLKFVRFDSSRLVAGCCSEFEFLNSVGSESVSTGCKV